MIRDLSTDLLIALRTLFKARGFAATAIVTLGLAMTLCAAVLVVVNAYLFRTLPYPGASRLYSVRYAPPGESPPRNLQTLNWSALEDAIEYPIAWDLDVFYLIGGDHPESAPGAWVTPGFVQGLGIRPAIGRGFEAGAFASGSPQVALISHRLWQRRFSADPNIVGRRFDAYVSDRPDEAEAFTIIGVLPPDVWHLNPYTDILTPLRAQTYPYLVRLREGVLPREAASRITALVRAGTTGLPAERQVELVSTHEEYVARLRPILRAVAVAAGIVLLVAWANVAGLLLIRATRRQKEIAVRTALGAGRLAIARLLMIEALVLGVGATAVGLVASGLTIQSLAPLIQRELGRPAPRGEMAFAIDGTVVAGAAVFGLLTALACLFAPLAASWRVDLSRALHSGSRTATEGRGSQRARSALIALEVAASLALLTGSTLMIQSVVTLLRVDLGIRAERVLSAPLTLRQRHYPDAASRLAFYERVLPRLAGISGVESVALGNAWPLQAPRPQTIEGGSSVSSRTSVQAVTAEYFTTLGMTVAGGRPFTSSDRAGSEPVALVSETLARRLWPNGRAIDERVRIVAAAGQDDDGRSAPRRVIGVVRDVRQTPSDEDLSDVYVPLLQTPGRFAWMYLRTSESPLARLPAIRSAFREIDPEISLSTARPLQVALDEQVSRPKFLASLLAGFALVAALLALVGVYGVIAYAVRQREREIAVRMALGADSRTIVGLFLRQGGVVLAAGVALGLLGAVGAGRTLESQLFGVSPADPSTLGITSAAFAVAGCMAVWWPARRAALTDPAVALKDD